MTPQEWGPPIWTLFHTLVERMREESYTIVGPTLFSFIYRISGYLPCPECSQHARTFLSNINPSTLKTKDDLRSMLYIFHNVVNKKKSKPMFNSELLVQYKTKRLIPVLNHFLSVYNNRGNMQMLTESFQRQFIIQDFKKWIMAHIVHFS